MYIIYDSYYCEFDRVTKAELDQLKRRYPGRYTVIGRDN